MILEERKKEQVQVKPLISIDPLSGKALRRYHVAGLTLLEVLVSLVIVSIVLVALVELENRDIRALSHCRKMTTAAILAKNMMSQVEMQEFPDLGADEGDFTEDETNKDLTNKDLKGSYADFTWKRTVETFQLGGVSFDNVRKVTITILWNEGKEQRDLPVVQYIAKRGGTPSAGTQVSPSQIQGTDGGSSSQSTLPSN